MTARACTARGGPHLCPIAAQARAALWGGCARPRRASWRGLVNDWCPTCGGEKSRAPMAAPREGARWQGTPASPLRKQRGPGGAAGLQRPSFSPQWRVAALVPYALRSPPSPTHFCGCSSRLIVWSGPATEAVSHSPPSLLDTFRMWPSAGSPSRRPYFFLQEWQWPHPPPAALTPSRDAVVGGTGRGGAGAGDSDGSVNGGGGPPWCERPWRLPQQPYMLHNEAGPAAATSRGKSTLPPPTCSRSRPPSPPPSALVDFLRCPSYVLHTYMHAAFPPPAKCSSPSPPEFPPNRVPPLRTPLHANPPRAYDTPPVVFPSPVTCTPTARYCMGIPDQPLWVPHRRQVAQNETPSPGVVV